MSTKKKPLGRYEKYPDETINSGLWGIDWGNDIASGDSISSQSIQVFDSSSVNVTDTLTNGSVSLATNSVTVAFVDGTAGETYDAQCIVETANGGTYEEWFKVFVRDDS